MVKRQLLFGLFVSIALAAAIACVACSPSNGSSGGGASAANVASVNSGNSVSSQANSTPEQQIQLGELITSENWEFQIDSVSWEEEIMPPNTSGVYSYYENEEGKVYLVFRGTFKNLGGEMMNIRFATKAEVLINDKYKIAALAEGSEQDGNDFFAYQVDPLETVQLMIYASVSDDMRNAYDHGKLNWYFTDNPRSYYDDRNMTHVYTVEFK